MMTEDTTESEYSLEYFGFTPETFFKDFSELVLEEMSSVIQSGVKQLTSPEYKGSNTEALIKNSYEIHQNWIQRAAVVLKKLQPTVQQVFTIPKNVLLPDYARCEKPFTEEDIKKLEAEVKDLEENFKKQAKTIAICKSELALLDHLEPIQKKVDEGIHVINQTKEVVNEIKELELIAQKYENNRQVFVTPADCVEDDDSDKNDYYSLHEWQFNVKK